MSGFARVVVPLARRLAPLLLAYGPKVVQAATTARKYLAEHPEVPTWFRKRFEDVQSRLVVAAERRGTAAQIRAALVVVRDEARREGAGLDAPAWIARADAIESGVRIAELRTGSARRAALADLKARTDDLAADLLDAMVKRPPRLE